LTKIKENVAPGRDGFAANIAKLPELLAPHRRH
jgi:hypothetical protein